MATMESEPRVVDVTVGGTVNAVLEFTRVNMVCDLKTSISPIEGLSIKSPPGGGLPTDIGELIIDMELKPDCHLWGVVWQPFPQLERIFPLPVELTIAGVMHPVNVMAPGYSNYDFTSKIMDLIRNGTINANTKSIEIVVKYPVKKTYNILKPSIFSYEYKEDTATVPVDLSLPVPITCTPSEPGFTAPASIPFKMPDLTSPPTLDITSFPILVNMSVPCVPAGTPAKLFPMDLDLTIYDGISDYPPVMLTTDISGIYSANIINAINGWVATKTPAELVDLSGITLILKYPEKVEFADANAVGVKTETKSVVKWIPIIIPVPPGGPITCTPSMSSLTTPANIPFKMPDPADLTSPPTLDLLKFDIAAAISVPCVPAGTPAKLFPMDLDLTIDDGISSITGLVTVAGAGIFTSNIVSMIKDLMLAKTRAELVNLSSVKLILGYPGKVEFADANAVGVKTETKSVEKWIPVSIPVPPTPGGCTEDTTFTCPDGTVITTGICNTTTGVLTPTGNVCPVPPTPGGCTEDATFTCPDGTVITTGICNTATGVLTPTGNVCPTPGCTEDTTITCLDGTVITTGICNTATGVLTPTGNVCPECTVNTVKTCDDGSEITTHLCIAGKLFPTGNVCPTPGCTEGTFMRAFTCPDGSVIQLLKCVDGVWVDSGYTCPSPIGCTEGTFMRAFTCPDGSVIQLLKCVDGVWVDSGQKCPEAPTGVKSVYTTTPLLSRVGKRVQIVGLVFCGTEKVGGEKAWISIDGELLTTANTRNGTVTAEWTPVVPGLYTICVTVPASSACNAYGSACTMMQVVAELSQEEIKAAEEEFERAKERIGEIMERI